MGIKVNCRGCNQQADSDSFKLHYQYKMMVCPNCFSGATKKRQEQLQKKPELPARPPGWDAEDDYLEKAAKLRKQENQAQFSKIPGTQYVRCTCLKCKFSFRYDPFRKRPRTCPYCNDDIPKLKTFNLL